jgi:hypothetical protein
MRAVRWRGHCLTMLCTLGWLIGLGSAAAQPAPATTTPPPITAVIVDRRLAAADAAANGRLLPEIPRRMLILCQWQAATCLSYDTAVSPRNARRDAAEQLAKWWNGSDARPAVADLHPLFGQIYERAGQLIRQRRQTYTMEDRRVRIVVVTGRNIQLSSSRPEELVRTQIRAGCFVPPEQVTGGRFGYQFPPATADATTELAIQIDGDDGLPPEAVQALAIAAGHAKDVGTITYLGQSKLGCGMGEPVLLPLLKLGGECRLTEVGPQAVPLACPAQLALMEPPQPSPPVITSAPAQPAPATQPTPPLPQSSPAPPGIVASPAPPAPAAGLPAAPLDQTVRFHGLIITTELTPEPTPDAARVEWRDVGSAAGVRLRLAPVAGGAASGWSTSATTLPTGAPGGSYRVVLELSPPPGECKEAAQLHGLLQVRGNRVARPVDIRVDGVSLICAGDDAVQEPVGEIKVE